MHHIDVKWQTLAEWAMMTDQQAEVGQFTGEQRQHVMEVLECRERQAANGHGHGADGRRQVLALERSVSGLICWSGMRYLPGKYQRLLLFTGQTAIACVLRHAGRGRVGQRKRTVPRNT